MSYILDALNKSEKERTVKRTPGIDALNDTSSPSVTFGLKSIIVLVMAIAVANGAVIYFFFGNSEQPITVAPIVEESVHEPEVTQPEPTKIPAEPASLPAIEVTAHIYAQEPDLRMVKIDGINRNEGDYLSENHQLIEITEIGVVLEYQGQRYSLDVVEDWQFR